MPTLSWPIGGSRPGSPRLGSAEISRLMLSATAHDLYILRKMPFLVPMFRGLTGRVRRWQCVSNDLKKLLLELHPEIDPKRVFVEPMPLGKGFYDMNHPRPGDLVVSCGSFIKRKRFDELIRVIAGVPGVRLRIFGEGPERPVLEALIEEHGLADRVELPGNVPREILNDAFNEASLFVLLSVDEGFGMVLKEAQAAGCPTMAPASDGMIDTGLDYPLEPSADVAARIRQILSL